MRESETSAARWHEAPYINMHPERVSRTDVCDGVERINGSIYRSSCCCIHVERNQTLHKGGGGAALHAQTIHTTTHFNKAVLKAL